MSKKISSTPASVLRLKSYGILDISDPLGLQREVLQHNTDPSKELFSLFEYFSEIDSIGDQWLKKKYSNYLKRKSVYLTFRSFIRQAKSYYYAAEGQDFNTAPLSYFYAFESLVRAYLTIKKGNTYKQKNYHGLDYKPKKDGKIYLKTKGVFADFYNVRMQSTLPSEVCLNIVKQLNYCSDISYEYKQLFHQLPAYIRGKSAFVITESDSLAHVVLAMTPPISMGPYLTTIRKVDTQFDKIELNTEQKIRILGIPLNEQHLCSYHISKVGLDSHKASFPIVAANIVWRLFPTSIFPSLLVKDQQFTVFLPLRANRVIDFNEVMAIYVVMFYLSNLVRYFPGKLNNPDGSGQIWLLKRFVESTPLTMLKYMVYLILDKQAILERI